MACGKILQVIHGRDALGFGCTEEVVLDGVGAIRNNILGLKRVRLQHIGLMTGHVLVSKGNLDRPLESVEFAEQS